MRKRVGLANGLLVIIGVGFGSARIAEANNCGFPTADQANVFQDINRGGACKTLVWWSYPTPSSFSPVPNDSISELDIGANLRVALFVDANYSGRVAYFDGSWYWKAPLPGINDAASSIKVFPASGGRMAALFAGNYPNDDTPYWTEDVQGVAHGEGYWFITQTTRLSKISLSDYLATVPIGSALTAGPPAVLLNNGYNHFGDPDYAHGFVFVPLQHTGDGPAQNAALAVFRASDLAFLSWQVVPSLGTGGGAFVAYRPDHDTLNFTNGSPTSPLYEYSVNWSTLANSPLSLGYVRSLTMLDRDGFAISYSNGQGGVFNSTGSLFYTVGGDCYSDAGDIMVFNVGTNSGTLQAQSMNGWGPFNYEHHGSFACAEEPEGLDFLDTTGTGIPGIPASQLHALVLDPARPGQDGIFFKHYSY